MRGKNINMFLMDGTPTGRIKCTIENWTGVAYKIPRTELERCKNRDDLKQSGVYFLFGESTATGKPVAYIGQAGNRKNGEGILYRLLEHKRNAEKKKVNLSEFVVTSLLEQIEDEEDLKLYEKAETEFNAALVTYSHEEVKKFWALTSKADVTATPRFCL